MRRGNRIIILLCALLLIVAVPVNATDNKELTEKETVTIQPRFSNISVFVVSFDITDGGKAIVESVLSARDCDEVEISMYLQCYENGTWTSIKHWSETRSSASMLLSKEWYVSSGYQYRMKAYGYVYSGGQVVENTSQISQSIVY